MRARAQVIIDRAIDDAMWLRRDPRESARSAIRKSEYSWSDKFSEYLEEAIKRWKPNL